MCRLAHEANISFFNSECILDRRDVALLMPLDPCHLGRVAVLSTQKRISAYNKAPNVWLPSAAHWYENGISIDIEDFKNNYRTRDTILVPVRAAARADEGVAQSTPQGPLSLSACQHTNCSVAGGADTARPQWRLRWAHVNIHAGVAVAKEFSGSLRYLKGRISRPLQPSTQF